MREFINVFYGDYYRVQNIGMVGSKYTLTARVLALGLTIT